MLWSRSGAGVGFVCVPNLKNSEKWNLQHIHQYNADPQSVVALCCTHSLMMAVERRGLV